RLRSRKNQPGSQLAKAENWFDEESMSRFTATRFLMGAALVVILLGFIPAEGWGTRYQMIEGITFSSDNSRILVTKLAARDACVSGKFYKADVSRTISWLDAATGKDRGVILRDFKPGNCGPAFQLWRMGRTSAVCNPINDEVSVTTFGGGNVVRNL